MPKLNANIHLIIDYLKAHPDASSKEIYDQTSVGLSSYVTLQRLLTDLVKKNFIVIKGSGKGTKYSVSAAYQVIHEINLEDYFKKEIDERLIRKEYNHDLIKQSLNKINLFTPLELASLNSLQQLYEHKTAALTDREYKTELERLAIDLSWKSSQIEGNTYSLLETERLLKDKETAAGKTKDEAVMLLNHKEAIDFIVEAEDYVKPLLLPAIEDIHSILVKELGVERNIRRRTVGISGTNYKPLDNEFQIKEAMEEVCALVNLKENAFEKALLVLLLISYIQPFNDGNKRTARIISNAILMVNGCCPISFRTVDSLEYKKAMLLFYEQNNVSAFKKIFIDQFEFACNTYF
ncbi:Fic family protein [Aurantibacillus circumpalustris]|uniref:Fic family protein n=1 Tax=Aurantibacillus circumpalustris TaxID=3036359 RepID=UPI00295C389C|nr:Fic family protein [Aurantibacillus circumpalustris]